MQRTKADSSGLEGFGPQQKRLIDLLEECTPKDQPCVQQSLLKEVKDILRAGNDEDVRVTFDTLMGRLGNVHAQARMFIATQSRLHGSAFSAYAEVHRVCILQVSCMHM